MNILAGSIRRAIPLWAVPIALTLFAVPQVARADADPVFCAGTVFGTLCANGVITGALNFEKFGNPQPLKSFQPLLASVLVAAFLDSVSLSLLNGAGGSASDTVAGFNAGTVGSDVSIPFANWVSPRAFIWTDNGPTGGGGFAFFNSFGTLNGRLGVSFANELIVGDPPDTFQLLEALDGVLGGTAYCLLPSTFRRTSVPTGALTFLPPIPREWTLRLSRPQLVCYFRPERALRFFSAGDCVGSKPTDYRLIQCERVAAGSRL
jgi:hypothetical protein